jgi:phosphoglycerate kinase
LQTVLWVGGVGYSNWKHFANGTRSLAKTLADLTRAEKCTTITQGKDLERAIRIVGGKVSHVTLGGSAAVTLLTGGALPGLAALDEVNIQTSITISFVKLVIRFAVAILDPLFAL